MNNYRVRTRLFALYAAICVMLAINGLWSFLAFQEYKVGGPSYTRIISNKDLVADILPPPEFVLEAYLTGVQIAVAKDSETLERLVNHFGKLRTEFEERHNFWKGVQLEEAIKTTFMEASYTAGIAFFQVVTDELIPAKRAGDQARTDQALSKANQHFDAHRNFIDQTVVLANQQAQRIETEVGGNLALAGSITVGLVLLTFGLAAIAAWRINLSITKPIDQSIEVVECMASGNLASGITVSGHDEFTQLLTALQEMQSGIAKIVRSIRQSATEVSASSAEIAQANADLSSRTEQQAASLEEVAATMEEIDSAVQQHAQGVQKAHELARQSVEVAAKGGEAVDKVVATMKEINTSSNRIADITSVIEGISFQTNILALNAAIEAARAGEHGRGFSVVAAEVRTLAIRAADAAREIEGLIDTIVLQVAQGSAQVDGAGATMSEVEGSIRQLASIMNSLSTANAEQSSGVSLVDGSIMQIDRATQENAGLVEEMAASAEVLRRQSAGLVDLVAKFNTGQSGAGTTNLPH